MASRASSALRAPSTENHAKAHSRISADRDFPDRDRQCRLSLDYSRLQIDLLDENHLFEDMGMSPVAPTTLADLAYYGASFRYDKTNPVEVMGLLAGPIDFNNDMPPELDHP